jgi:hypothetical protein
MDTSPRSGGEIRIRGQRINERDHDAHAHLMHEPEHWAPGSIRRSGQARG